MYGKKFASFCQVLKRCTQKKIGSFILPHGVQLPYCGRCQDNEWRQIFGFQTGVVDSKLSRGEMESFADAVEVKLRGWEGNRRSGSEV